MVDIWNSDYFEHLSNDNNEGYDPFRNELLDDSDKAYQPFYVPSESGEGYLSDNLSDSDDDPDPNKYKFAPSPPKESPKNHDSYQDPKVKLDHSESNSISTKNTDNDREYNVEPLLDVTTPAYAPSIAYDSDSSSVYSDYSNVSGKHTKVLESEIFNGNCESPFTHVSNEIDYDKKVNEQIKPDIAILNESSQYDQNLFEDNDEDRDINKYNDEFEGFERDEQPESQVDGIIADIFGESDAEEEFEGFAENELDKVVEEDEPSIQNTINKQHKILSGDECSGEDEEFVSDFDLIMEKRKEEFRYKRRRNKDIEFLNDGDDLIVEITSRMRNAADEDRQLLVAGQPATKKLTMLKDVTSLLRRADLKSALIDNGILSGITEWLSPLPGHTLPNLVIRDSLLNCLSDFQSLSSEVLKESGIGKALMYLYKHPRETRENKDKAGRLINEWLRPIFNLTSDYRTLTKEERKQLDYEHLPKRRNIESESHSHRDINRELDGESKGLLRPGDPGWIGRARVPQPSNKDYIIRPKWRVSANYTGLGGYDDDDDGNDGEIPQTLFRRHRKPGSSCIGPSSRIESHIRNLANSARRSHARAASAVPMSIEGRKMSL